MDEWGNRSNRRIEVTRKVRQLAARPPAAPKPKKKSNPFASVHFGTYHALVIGNNKYRNFPKLKSAIADAEAVAGVLRDDYGFKVSVLKNATRSGIIGAMSRMRARLRANDNLLVYYAGHGVIDSVTEQGYWLPVDSEEGNPANWISTSDVTTLVRGISAKHVMVVADSCYSGTLVRAVNPQIRTGRARLAWVKRMLSKRSRTALVSGGLEPVTDSGGGGHSVFAKAFMDALRENRTVMEGQSLYDRIKRPVVLNSNQTPQYSDIRLSGHDGGDFLFVRRGSNK